MRQGFPQIPARFFAGIEYPLRIENVLDPLE